MQVIPKKIVKTSNSIWAGVFLGIGLMAGIDEIVFHQILAWHHFYDLSTSEIGLLSDGLLHALELVALVAGFFFILKLKRNNALLKKQACAGLFFGLGGFQLFDGIVNHKVLRIHQIRYVENLLLYDILWNASALLLLGIGFILMRRARQDRELGKASIHQKFT